MIKRIKKIFSVKLLFKLPQKYDLVIFDNTSISDLKLNLLKNQKYFVFKNRINEIDEVYITPFLIFKILINLRYLFKDFFIQDVYFLSLLQSLKPKIVFTIIDTDFQFSKLGKILEKEDIKFVALQGAMRHVWLLQDYMYKKKLIKNDLNKKYFFPVYLCFSEYEKYQCLKLKINVKKFILVGSLRLVNFLLEKENKVLKKKYDICLLSDYGAWLDRFDGVSLDILKQAENGYIKLIEWSIEFCRSKNLKFVFSFKRRINTHDYFLEKSFYKNKLSEVNYNFLIENSSYNQKDMIYKSYYSSFQSELTIAKTSTLLRETLACNNKILACNLTNSNLFDFPIKGICSLNNCSFDEFEKRVENILKIKSSDYFSKIKENKNYLVYDSNPKSVINSILKELMV